MKETRELARFATNLKYSDLSPEVIHKTKNLILDQWGVELACSTKPWGQMVYRYFTGLGGKDESTILNYGDKIPAESAAFVNATFGHGFEFDDSHGLSSSHPGSVIVPTVMAMGEREKIDGKLMILAVVTGYEVMCKIGQSVNPAIVHRGHHPTSSLGPFGAAAAAGKILDFSLDQMLNAISVAGSFSSGLSEFMVAGGTVKRIHGAIGAQSGIRAALFAREGLTGPPTILEGERGFCKTFADEYRLKDITANLGKTWAVLETNYKRYSCCYGNHASIDALSKIMNEHQFNAADVEEVIAGVSRAACGAVGNKGAPASVTEAQFNAPFTLAMTLVKGSNVFKDYNEDNLKDPEILAMSKKLKVVVDKEVDAEFPRKFASRVTLKLKNGTSYQEKIDYAKGTTENPITDEELKDKFRGLATIVMPVEMASKIIDAVSRLEKVKDVSSLAEYLNKRSIQKS